MYVSSSQCLLWWPRGPRVARPLVYFGLAQAHPFLPIAVSRRSPPHRLEMKYSAAYTLCVLGGNATPSAADLAKVITACGGECDAEAAEKLVSELSAKVRPSPSSSHLFLALMGAPHVTILDRHILQCFGEKVLSLGFGTTHSPPSVPQLTAPSLPSVPIPGRPWRCDRRGQGQDLRLWRRWRRRRRRWRRRRRCRGGGCCP